VIERTATQGEVVGPDKTIFYGRRSLFLVGIIDLYEKDLGASGGHSREVRRRLCGKNVQGRDLSCGDMMDEKTRTVKARVVVENGNRQLKPGISRPYPSTSRIQADKAFLVPDEAMLMDGEERFVFIHEPVRKHSRSGRSGPPLVR